MSAIGADSSAGGDQSNAGSPRLRKSSYSTSPSRSPGSGVKRVVVVDDQQLPLQALERGSDDGREGAVGDDRLRLAVLEDVGHGVGVETRVDRVEHRAEHRHAEMRLDHRRHVRQHRRDGVALPNGALRERGGEPPGALVEIRVREPPRRRARPRSGRDGSPPTAAGTTTGVSVAKLAGPGLRPAQMLAPALGAGRRRARAGDFARARRFTAGAILRRDAAARRVLAAISLLLPIGSLTPPGGGH